jgi:hypothetical protein
VKEKVGCLCSYVNPSHNGIVFGIVVTGAKYFGGICLLSLLGQILSLSTEVEHVWWMSVLSVDAAQSLGRQMPTHSQVEAHLFCVIKTGWSKKKSVINNSI